MAGGMWMCVRLSFAFIFSFLITFPLFLSCLRTGNIRNQVPSNDRAGTKWQRETGPQCSVPSPLHLY